MKHVNGFQSWLINEAAGTSGTSGSSAPYPSLENYLTNYPDLIACLQKDGKQQTHILNGSYFKIPRDIPDSEPGMGSVDLFLNDIALGKKEAFGDTGPGTTADRYYRALAQLVEYLKKNPSIVISTTEFPLPPGVTVTGKTSNLLKTN